MTKEMEDSLFAYLDALPSQSYSQPPASVDGSDSDDPHESEEYAAFVDSMADKCNCDGPVCAGVLAGGPCDEFHQDNEPDCEPDFTLDDLDWVERY